jgi:GcrA cell cycle regulator
MISRFFTAWSEQQLTFLRDNWGAISAQQIGDKIGKTRNAVIGQANRLKLKIIGSTAKHRASSTRKIPDYRTQTIRSEIVMPKKVYERITVANVKDIHCRWPIGNPREKGFMFCGSEAVPGKPYCLEHCRICYVNAPKRERGVAQVCVQIEMNA